MRARPTSVTVIGLRLVLEVLAPWTSFVVLLLIVEGEAFFLDRATHGDFRGRIGSMLAQSVPHGVPLAKTLAFILVDVACGIGLLRGSNAVRWLYMAWLGGNTIWGGVSFVGTGLSPLSFLLGGCLHTVLTVGFLFTPRANRWFAGDDSDPGDAYGLWTVAGFLVGVSAFGLATGMLFGPSFQWAIAGICAVVVLGCVVAALAGTGWRHVGRDLAIVAAGVALLTGPGLPRLIQHSRDLARQSLPASRTPEGRYAVAEARLVRAGTAALPRFNALGRAAKAAYDAGHYDEARTLAQELEKAVPDHVGEWDYGNAIQDSNVVLGRLALREGDVDEAKARLLAAGGSPGSPQMDSFGPNVSLAADLLAKGETEAVLQYFAACRSFWTMDHGQLDAWTEAVKRGETPRFGANLLY